VTHKKAPQIKKMLDNIYFVMCDLIRPISEQTCDLICPISEPTSGTCYNTYTRKPSNKMTEVSALQIQEGFVLEFRAETL